MNIRWWKWVAVALWLLVAASASPLAAKLLDVTTDDQVSWLPRSAEATAAYQRAVTAFPGSDATVAMVVYSRADGLTAVDRAKADGDRIAFTALARGSRVEAAVPSADGRALLFSFPLATDDPSTGAAIKQQLARDRPDGLTTALTGPAGMGADLAEASGGVDSTLILVTGMVVAALLLLTYRSPVLWAVPLLVVAVASQLASAVVYLLVHYGGLTVNSQGQGIVTVLVFGAGTDYALLLISRYREELCRHHDRHQAMAAALRASWPALLASAATVILALLCLLAAQLNSTRGMGPGAAVGVAAAFLAMVTLLPALLVIGGRWLFWPFIPRAGTEAATLQRGWNRVAGVIARYPRRIWIGTALVLSASALGMLSIQVGLTPADTFTRPVDSVTGQDLITAHYPGGLAGPADILARADRASPQVSEVWE